MANFDVDSESQSETWAEDTADNAGLRMWIRTFKTCGMRRVYARAEATASNARTKRHLEVWKARDGRLFARMWITNSSITREWHQIQGCDHLKFPRHDDRWVPRVLRDHYLGWSKAMTFFIQRPS